MLPQITHSPPPAHLWRRAVVDALRPHVASIPQSFDRELCALDSLHATWWQRYGRTAAASEDACRSTEPTDRQQLLVPLVEKLVALQAACQQWPPAITVNSGVGRRAIGLPADFKVRQYQAPTATTSAKDVAPQSRGIVVEHSIATPLDAAAVLLLEDACRTFHVALQRLDDIATSVTQEPCFVAQRAKESFQLCQAAYIVATAALQLPLARDAYASPSHAFLWSEIKRTRQVALLGVAASQYFFALWTEATSAKHKLLASLATAAADACHQCSRDGVSQGSPFVALSRLFVAASLRHRGEMAYAADVQRKEVPDMRMALGCMTYAADLLHEGDPSSVPPPPPALFPIANRLKSDVQRLQQLYARENTLIYHTRPVPKEEIPSMDVEVSMAWALDAPLLKTLTDRIAAAAATSPFISAGLSFTRVCEVVSSSSSSDDDRFEDAQEEHDVVAKRAAPHKDDFSRLLQALLDAFASLGVTATSLGLWIIDALRTLNAQLDVLRAEARALHEQQKQFVTANVKDAMAEVVKRLSEDVRAWYASAFATMQQPCSTHIALRAKAATSGGDVRSVSVGDLTMSISRCVPQPSPADAATSPSVVERRILDALRCLLDCRSCDDAALEDLLVGELRSVYEGPVRGALGVQRQLTDAIDNVRRCLVAITMSGIANAAPLGHSSIPPQGSASSGGTIRQVGSRLRGMFGGTEKKRARSEDGGEDGDDAGKGGAQRGARRER